MVNYEESSSIRRPPRAPTRLDILFLILSIIQRGTRLSSRILLREEAEGGDTVTIPTLPGCMGAFQFEGKF